MEAKIIYLDDRDYHIKLQAIEIYLVSNIGNEYKYAESADLIHHKLGGVVYKDECPSPSVDRSNTSYPCCAIWKAVAHHTLTFKILGAAASRLGGSWRTCRIFTTKFHSGHAVEFLAPDEVACALARWIARVNAAGVLISPLRDGVLAFFDFLRIHPFTDGNGRIARMLLSSVVATRLGLSAPLPLIDKVLARNRPAFLKAAFSWYLDDDARPMLSFVHAALALACEGAGQELPLID